MSGFTPVDQNPAYQHAYHLTTLGFTLIPLHFPQTNADGSAGACSCGDSACAGNTGKHPVGGWKKITEPELGLQHVHLAVNRYGWCNLGLLTGKKRGPAPGIVAIDLDVKEGKNGVLAFQGWCAEHGVTPEQLNTTRARTGSGGYHLVFLYPEGDLKIPSGANRLVTGGGIDIRGEGGYIAVAPSRHRSGGYYVWEVPLAPEYLLPLPQALVDALQGGTRFTGEPGRRKVAPYTPTLDDLIDLAAELKRNKQSRKRSIGKDLELAIRGEPIAQNGGGHDAYRDVLMHVGMRWSQAEPRETLEHFRASVEARQHIRPEASCGMENLLDSLTSAQAKAHEEETSWNKLMSYTAKGEVKACEGNVVIALENHAAWKGVLAHNDRTQQTMFMRQPPIEACIGPFPRAITDADGVQIAKWFTIETRVTLSGKQCLPAAFSVGRSVIYDPFKEWLEALPAWDGISRAETWLISCAGAVDNVYVREVSLRWLLQSVWRTYVPGCQADYTLILQGPQGIKKSTLLAALLPDPSLFVDHLPHVGTKDATIALQGPVIIEIAELSAFKRSENESMKSFLTTKYDSVRLPYDKLNSVLPRRCVIAGTTNDDAYLRDATGNRRYWPVSVASCDPACLAANREQLWAELVARFKAGDRCYLDKPTEALAAVEQNNRYEGDSWESQIDAWLQKPPPPGAPAINYASAEGVSLNQIFEHALQLDDRAKWNRAAEMRVVAILKRRKYERVRRTTSFSGGLRIWVYVKNN